MFSIVHRGDEYSNYDEFDGRLFETIEAAESVILKNILYEHPDEIREHFDPQTGKTSPTTLEHLKHVIDRGLGEKTIIEIVQTKRPSLDDYSDETIQSAFDKWMEADRKQSEEYNKLNLEDKRRQLERLKKELEEE